MSSIQNPSRLISSLLIATSLILASCQESSHTVTAKVAGGGGGGSKAGLRQSKLTTEEQKYVMDPTTLEVYQDNLSKIFSDLSSGAPTSWDSFFKLKTWLLGPMNLSEQVGALSKTYLSISSSPVASQKALQVRIDSRSFDKLNADEKVDFLLNEFLISLYTLRGLTDSQLCEYLREISTQADCKVTVTSEGKTKQNRNNRGGKKTKSSASLVGSASAAISSGTSVEDVELTSTEGSSASAVASDSEAGSADTSGVGSTLSGDLSSQLSAAVSSMKELTSGDINNITRVKKYIQDNSRNLRHEDLVAKMKENGFDVRIFSIKFKVKDFAAIVAEVKKSASEELSKIDIESLFSQVENLKEASVSCHAVSLDKESECDLSGERLSEVIREKQRALLHFELKEKESKKETLKETVFQPEKVGIAAYTDVATGEEFFLVPLTSIGVAKQEKDEKFWNSYMLVQVHMKNKVKQWELTGLLFIPGVITDVQKNAETGKVVCEGRKPETSELATDVILVSKESQYLESVKKMLAAMKPTPPCW
ncbi:MAG: hypothetical protein AAGB31_00075 [Bdellovibrio sp.]